MALAGAQSGCAADADQITYDDPSLVAATPQTGEPAAETAQQLDQLVAPIALYPDALIAQILTASTFPTEVVEADRWIQQNSSLKGDALAAEVDKQPWDASVKALTQSPAILANMDQNLSWSSALGEAYADQPQEVLDAVQAMRQRAQEAGNLTSTPQESVTTEGQTIIIDPTNPDIVYIPEYDPWLVYGAPLAVYPDWVAAPELFLDRPGFAWGLSFGVVAGFGWGWHHWTADWHHHRLDFDHHRYISHSRDFFHPDFGARANFAHLQGFHGPYHGVVAPHHPMTMHSSAFSGFGHGGLARSYSFRGASSLGGFHSGFAGGFHGGGFHGGGGGHR